MFSIQFDQYIDLFPHEEKHVHQIGNVIYQKT